jgi:hypothetical protein
MVVFQYGSIVLFNVSDHEADGYLKIVEKHASGLLPEMRKDGKPKNTHTFPKGVEFSFFFICFEHFKYLHLISTILN